MVVLPRGITGFYVYKEAPPPRTNERHFLNFCHTIAQQLGGSVSSHERVTEHREKNFSFTTIQLPHEEPIAILLNAHFPILAAAEPLTDSDLAITFRDAPQLTDEFHKQYCYKIFSASELKEGIVDATISVLSVAETDQIKYWKPSTVGELIFNFWD